MAFMCPSSLFSLMLQMRCEADTKLLFEQDAKPRCPRDTPLSHWATTEKEWGVHQKSKSWKNKSNYCNQTEGQYPRQSKWKSGSFLFSAVEYDVHFIMKKKQANLLELSLQSPILNKAWHFWSFASLMLALFTVSKWENAPMKPRNMETYISYCLPFRHAATFASKPSYTSVVCLLFNVWHWPEDCLFLNMHELFFNILVMTKPQNNYYD